MQSRHFVPAENRTSSLGGAVSSQIESQFRDIEHRFDSALAKDYEFIVSRGIATTDSSARTYHYKNDCLSWRYTFESRQPRDSEFAKVSVDVCVQEPNVATATFRRRVELFQLGKQSRWRQDDEFTLPAHEVIQRGIAEVVLPWIADGQAIVSRVA